MGGKTERVDVLAGDRQVSISSPNKIIFPNVGVTKLDVVQYFLAVGDGALRGAGGRPNVLVRYPDGIEGEVFWQKRAPSFKPDWVGSATLRYASGRSADEVVPRDLASLIWMINLGCLELHPHPLRADDLEHPDELRIDLDPGPDVGFDHVREVAKVARAVLRDFGLAGFPKTSGSRGIHILVRIERRWTQGEVRDAAMAFALEVEKRAPKLATAKWWKEERHGVFVDFNQNAKDRTVASAYSIRAMPDARVSMPIFWDELDACDPADFTLRSVPKLYKEHGDKHAGIDAESYSLTSLLELAKTQEKPKTTRAKQTQARAAGASGRRQSTKPLIEIARAEEKADALLGVERWKARHPEATKHLEAADILVDAMRGRYRTWTRIRINLEHVPEALRPAQEALDPDYDPGDIRPVNAGGASRRNKST